MAHVQPDPGLAGAVESALAIRRDREGAAARHPGANRGQARLASRGVEQQLGDFYASCMDATTSNQLGAKPIEPLLGEIAAIKDRSGLRAMISKLAEIGLNVPFGVYG